MNIKRYEHIIWDWNGTLLDDVWLCIEIINDMLTERKMAPMTLDTYRQIFDFPVKNYYQRAGFSFDDEPFEALATQFCNVYDARVNECQLFAQVPTLLESVSNSGALQSILSATEQNKLNQMAELFDVDRHFDLIVGQHNNSAAGKVETGQSLIKILEVDRNDVLLIGDTTHDYEVATQIGVDCLLIAHGHNSKEKLNAHHYQVSESLDGINY